MKYNTDDTRITGMEEVDAPEILSRDLPVSDAASEFVYNTRVRIGDILHGRDDRLLVVMGPCSIHDTKAAIEYGRRLKDEAHRWKDTLEVVMRVYFEKPRTTVGWKGLINDPRLNNSFDINQGLRLARGLLRDLVEMGLAAGTEYLDPITPQYVGDLVSWGAIGARTTESQVHRQLASGLSCPIGFKNSTLGSIQVAVDAAKSARSQHIFLSVTKAGHSAIFSTKGNEDCHIILRGGGGGPNYDSQSVKSGVEMLKKAGLPARLMIDMSHANSGKEFKRQLEVCTSVCHQLRMGEPGIMGVMVESNLVEGKQSLERPEDLVYGQSITDSCLGWEDSVGVLRDLDAAVRERRARG
jgi:3-deoxy-7-phosphoheptulonate synthase